MIATKNEVLDKALLEFPGLRQGEVVENSQFIRFTVELHHNREDHDNPPEIFLILLKRDYMVLALHPANLEEVFRIKIRQTEWEDASSHNIIRTGCTRTAAGGWLARTVDGSEWHFDHAKNYWAKKI